MKIIDKKLDFLEELRAIAKLGLNYTKDSYDRERYKRLLQLSATQYSELSGLSADVVQDRFKQDLGHITPKVGVNGAIFSDSGQLLLTRRADDNLWELPGGWVEVCESPQQALSREMKEEIGLEVEIKHCMDVFARMPGLFGQPHTSCHLLFHCISRSAKGREYVLNDEVVDIGYFDLDSDIDWHRDHEEMAIIASNWWLKQNR